MVDTVVHIVGIAIVVLLVATTFRSIQIDALGTFQFTLGKAMLTSTFSNTYSSDNTSQDVVLLTTDGKREGILGATYEERSGTRRSTLEGWISLLAHL